MIFVLHRPSRRDNRSNYRLPKTLLGAWVPRVHRRTLRHLVFDHLLLWAKVRFCLLSQYMFISNVAVQTWQEEYAMVYRGMQFDWRYQCQCNHWAWLCYRHHCNGGQSGRFTRFFLTRDLSLIVISIQFKHWFIYFLLVFVAATLSKYASLEVSISILTLL